MIEIEKLNYNVNGKDILKDVSFSITQGEIIGLIGENGSGKTSLLRMISGLSKATSTEIRRDDISTIGQFENLGYPKKINVKSLFKIFNLIHKNPNILASYISKFNLKGLLNNSFSKCSYGEQKKIGLCDSLCSNSDLVIFDEPTNGIDYKSVNAFYRIVKKQQRERNRTFLICTHNLDEIKKIATKFIVLKSGELFCVLNSEEIETYKNIESIYDRKS